MAHIARSATDKGNRVLFFSHRKEINEQVERTFAANGVNSNLLTIGGVQSLVRKLDSLSQPEVILIDEAHHSKAKSYLKIIDHFKSAYVLMFTGTPVRLNGDGFDDIVDDLVAGKSVKWLQEHGNIANFKYYAPSMIDNSALKKRGGEFTKDSVNQSMKSVIYGDVIKHYEKLAKGKQAIVYTHSVEASHLVSDTFNQAGYQSQSVSGKTSKSEREEAMQAFRDGKLRILVNCELFTEGIDLPNVDVCIMLRPTQSLSLYLQFAMRPLNPRDGKIAIIIDHVGNVERFGLPNMDREWRLDGKTKQKQSTKIGEPTTRVCDDCYATYWSDTRICPECGHENELTKREIEEIKEAELQEISEQKQLKLKNRVSTYQSPDLCRTMDELTEYRKQHGYKPGWQYHIAKKLGILY
ncbi:TPA: DEAD/DEAH box helicase [Streptococcus pyogenes]|uniref:DEAD/DEAH box helicase n=1 Tax=Streptococcus pyogenes TaxID=1314 RepID=UPI00109CA906|nr:DEAD/DEAH box helicase [Streptococcus pyogenes]VGS90711.1 phage DNA/RNA helicase [Streptococcus pyogenes]VGV24176.1 phage DNA/RNA helicase [Streptococcus pyogenes]VGV36567.1 phage DNA/RNA helicase [Streptococcus pyogenes]VGV86303.1 phage DNA/RNA helicase [Streptococcus pyogenes]VGV89042.1 phage DNA/RNA helicase [Streptococcus pyogenes]